MSSKNFAWAAIALGAVGGGIVATLVFRHVIKRLRSAWQQLWKGFE